MRIFLILLAAVAVAIAAAVTLLPRLIDPELLRNRVVVELQAATGRPLTVRGAAELSWLPRPTLTIGRVALGRPAGEAGGPTLEVDRVDLVLAPAALLGVQLSIEGARLVRPRLTLRDDDVELLPGLARVLGEETPLARVDVVDGDVVIDRAGSAREELSAVELELTRGSRDLDLSGSARWHELPVSVSGHVATMIGSLPAPIELRLGLGEDASLLEVSGAGTIRPGGAFEGEVRVDAPELARPLGLALGLAGRGGAGFGDARLGRLALRARVTQTDAGWRIDLPDAAIGSSSFSGLVALSDGLRRFDVGVDGQTLTLTPDMIAVASALDARRALPMGLAGALDMRFAVVEWRGDAVRDARLAAELGRDGGLTVKRLSARLPGGGEVTLAGVGATGRLGFAWQGQGSVSAPDLPALAAWLRTPLPRAAPDRLRSLVGRGSFAWSGQSLTLRDLDLLLDSSRAQGSLALQLAGRPQVAAVLAIDRLSLDGYAPRIAPGELVVALAELAGSSDIAATLTFDSLSWAAVRASHVRLDGEISGGRLTLRELSIGDLDEASGKLVGDGDLATGELDLALDAQIGRPARLARLAGIEPPAMLSGFAPVRVAGALHGRRGQLAAELSAVAPGFTLDLDTSLPASLVEPPSRLSLRGRAPSFAGLLGQLGLAERPGPAYAGPAQLDADVEALPDGGLRLAGELALGPSKARAAVTLEQGATRPRLSGSIGIDSFDPDLVNLGFDVGELALGLPPGPPCGWGGWPPQPLGWSWLRALDLDLAVDWPAGDKRGSGKLSLADGALELLGVDAPVAGGWLSGRLDLDDRGAVPLLTTTARLESADAAALLALAGLRNGMAGHADLDLAMQTGGASIADLIGALGGEVGLAVRDGRLVGVRLADDGDPLAPLETPFSALAGRLAVDHGVVTGDALSLDTPAGAAAVGVRLDLVGWMLDVTIRPNGASRPPIRLVGAPGRLVEQPPAAAPP